MVTQSFRPTLWLPILVAFIALLLTTTCQSPQQLVFSIRVDDPGDLKAGQPVVHLGASVGTVREILRESEDEATLVVEIPPEYRDEIYREMAFRIVEDDRFGPVLLLEDSEEERSGIEDGEVIDARSDWVERFMRRAGELGRAARETFEDLGMTVDQVIRDLEASPEAQALRKSLEEFAHDVQDVSDERLRKFAEEDLPELDSRAEAYRDKLVEDGRDKEAEVFWKWYARWAEAVRKKVQEPAK